MVEAFVGLVGGGKSYNSVRRMMSYMALGGRVCSNIRLTGYDEGKGDLSEDSPVRGFLRSIGWEYQPRQYIFIPFDDMIQDFKWIERVPAGVDREHKTLLVVDEATDLFDTLDGGKLRTDSEYREIFHFLRLSRHVHIDVLFIAQDLNSINKRLQGLVSNIWRSTDMKKFRLAKLKVPFPFDLFMLQQFDRTGKYETRREWVKKDLRVFNLYESEAFNQSLAVKWDGVSISNGKIKKVKKMTKFEKLLLVVALVCSVCALFRAPERRVVAPVVSPSSASSRVAAASPSSETNQPPVVVRDSFVYHSAVSNTPAFVVFGDKLIQPFIPCEWGTPFKLLPNYVFGFTHDQKGTFYLLPNTEPAKTVLEPVKMRIYRKKL